MDTQGRVPAHSRPPNCPARGGAPAEPPQARPPLKRLLAPSARGLRKPGFPCTRHEIQSWNKSGYRPARGACRFFLKLPEALPCARPGAWRIVLARSFTMVHLWTMPTAFKSKLEQPSVGKRTALTAIRFDDEDRDLLEACAQAEKLTKADTLRRALRIYAAQLGVKLKKRPARKH